MGIVSGSYTGQVQLWIYRSAGLYTGRVQTWFSLCMVSLHIYRTGTGVDVVFVEFHSTCKYRMGTEVDVVLVEDQGMYMIGETWMLPVESIGVCTDEHGRGCSLGKVSR